MNEEKSMLIVGGGAAAFAAATKAADHGVRVTMVNSGLPLGGTCVNVGCMPSKMLLEAAKRYREAAHPSFLYDGWLKSSASLEWRELKSAKDRMVAAARRMNYHDVIEALGNVTLVEGRAHFTGPKEVKVNGARHAGDVVMIATGARTLIPPVPGLVEAEPLTNVTALELEDAPRSIAVVGGGPLGLEFAQIFARAGAEVTAVELMGRILPQHEPEIGEELEKHIARDGIRVKAGCRLVKVEGGPGETKLYDSGGCIATVDRVLAATGIRPNTDGMGLEAAGVALGKGGFVDVNERFETSVPGVFAAGDVTGKMPLETVAARQGALAAENAITGSARTIDYDLVPHAVFTDPQVAAVGWTEERMMRELGTCWCRTLPMEWIPKAHAVGDTRGLAKLVVHPDTRKILGAHCVAPNAADIIHIPVLAIRAGMTIDDLGETTHVFPTFSEVWKFAALAFDRDPETMSCCIV
ncbi:MAG: mercury(II) reductase [Methanobacteriota archaeon]